MKITSNAAWLVGCHLSGNFLNLALFVTISRSFGPSGIGAYSYAFAIAGFVYVLGNLGIDEYGIREYARLPAEKRHGFISKVLGTQVLMLAVAVVALAVYLLLTRATLVTMGIAGSLAIYQLGYALARTLFVPAMAGEAMAGPALAELSCRGGAYVVAALAIILADSSLLAAMSVFSVFGLLVVVAGIRSAYRRIGAISVLISREAAIDTVRRAWSFAAVEIMGQVFIRTGIVTLSLVMGEEATGLYATGLKFVEVACMPLAFLGIAAYPRLSQLSAFDPPGFVRVTNNLFRVWLVASGLILWGLYFVVPSFLVPVLGAKFAGTEPVLRHMVVLALMQVLEALLVRLSFAADLQVQCFRTITGGAILSVILNMVLVPWLGVGGAIVAGTIALATVNVLYTAALQVRIPSSVLWQNLVMLAAGLAPAVAAAWILDAYGQPELLAGLAFLVTFLSTALPMLAYQHGALGPR